MPILRINIPDEGESVHVLRGDRITIGRRPDNTVQILDRSVSGHHAELIFEGDHYRLHDLGSTNLCFVEGQQVADFHLHHSCKVQFGNVEAEFDARPNAAQQEEPQLTPSQLEKDMAFLRAENQELLNTMSSLQRRIDILSSARLITGKSDTSALAAPEQVKKLTVERDELRYHLSGLKLELDKVRDELTTTARERDEARRANEILKGEKVALARQLEERHKSSTARIVVPQQASETDASARQNEDRSSTQKIAAGVGSNG